MSIQEVLFRLFTYLKILFYRTKVDRITKTGVPTNFEIPSMSIFGKSLNKISDWHLDISSNKKFPLIYAFDIDIRTEKYGSAKYVWEVNRLLFLPQIAIKFKESNNEKILNQIIDIISDWHYKNPYLIGVNWYSNIEVNIRLINFYFTWEILEVEDIVKKNSNFLDFVRQIWLPLIEKHCKHSFSFPSLFSSANNHLISEFSGLFVASSKWKFTKSKKWRLHSLKGLESEICKQYTQEGINKEESAEYIQFINDFFLIAYSVDLKSYKLLSETFKKNLLNCLSYNKYVLNTRGEFLNYGDEDDGKVVWLNKDFNFNNFKSQLVSGSILSCSKDFLIDNLVYDSKNHYLFGSNGEFEFNKLLDLEIPLLETKFFPESGHFIFRKQEKLGKEILLHFDTAPLGYLSIAAHGHADALSIILHIDGYPFIVDSGTYSYHTEKEWRSYFVSTLAHNTIEVNNQNQAVRGGALLWTKHYNCKAVNFEIGNEIDFAEGQHDGYSNLGIIHSRKVTFDKKNDLFEIADRLDCKKETSSTLFKAALHFHPKCYVEWISNTQIQVTRPEIDRKLKVEFDGNYEKYSKIGVDNPIIGWYSSSFYKKEPNLAIIQIGEIKSNKTELVNKFYIQ